MTYLNLFLFLILNSLPFLFWRNRHFIIKNLHRNTASNSFCNYSLLSFIFYLRIKMILAKCSYLVHISLNFYIFLCMINLSDKIVLLFRKLTHLLLFLMTFLLSTSSLIYSVSLTIILAFNNFLLLGVPCPLNILFVMM